MLKIIIVGTLCSFFLCSNLFSQCTPNGVKVQTPACPVPSGLNTDYIGCTKAKLMWTGDASKSYIIEMEDVDSTNRRIITVTSNDKACDNAGNCAVTVDGQNSKPFIWNVQAICSVKNATLYSYPTDFKKAVIPACTADAAGLKPQPSLPNVFPNPTTRYVMVQITKGAFKNVVVTVFDMNGKQVLQQNIAATESGLYKVDLYSLSPGTYVLKADNGTIATTAKIILLKG